MKALLRSCFIGLLIVAMYAGVSASTTQLKAFPGGSVPTCDPTICPTQP